jgi:hypothetical protein
MSSEVEEQIDANFDAQVQARSGDEETLIENNLHLISDIMKPDLRNLTSGNIKDKEKSDELLKEFKDVSKEWASGNIDKEDQHRVEEYNELIGYEMRMGYHLSATSDMRSVLNILGTSRSLKGKNLELLFSKILRFEKTTPNKDAKR